MFQLVVWRALSHDLDRNLQAILYAIRYQEPEQQTIQKQTKKVKKNKKANSTAHQTLSRELTTHKNQILLHAHALQSAERDRDKNIIAEPKELIRITKVH